MTHWAAQYIGTPYEVGAQGPHAFNCWGFARHVQRAHFARELPLVDVDQADAREAGRAIARSVERAQWRRAKTPCEGDLVALGAADDEDHIGVWIDADHGGVLHCARPVGVIFTHAIDLGLQGWPRVRFWRFHG